MTWTLALTATPLGLGTAKLGASGVIEITGFYPEIDRAVSFSSEGEETRVPDKVVLIIESDLQPHELKWYLGELVIAGIPGHKVQVRNDVEVLSTALGEQATLVTYPTAAPKKNLFGPQPDPKPTPVTVSFPTLGERSYERVDVAKLALEFPTEDSLVTMPPPSDTPVELNPERNINTTRMVLILVLALIVVLAVVFLL
ncbi:MAG: hypothetical protein GX859_11870 [Corynebacterium humireducens]|jgi:hypothetical protein|uniref:Uncharacterized protein n=1 Tax=Corynebacterium humireducens TaxID=1223514 RepID=A0A7X6PQL4_9CORY|nr:hypothetical protein [Corynebacterium humireducens]